MARPLATSPDWPPRYAAPFETQGPLRRFGAITWLRTFFPGFAQQFTGEVPAEFWTEDVAEDRLSVAIISCPCGSSPEVHDGATAICDGEDCGRVFMRLGDQIRVAKFDPTELCAEEPELPS